VSGRASDGPGGRAAADVAVAAFHALRAELFDPAGSPVPFRLRDKLSTQDDPLDEHLAQRLGERLGDEAVVVPATGPLISPDMVVAAPAGVREIRRAGGELTTAEAVGIEVKKLQRSPTGRIARPGGVDYNSTPPSRTISVFHDRERITLPGFYLFVCLEDAGHGRCRVTAMALCDGGVLNEDVALYEERTGIRRKTIGLGSFGDGLDRERPMLVFANPLGWRELDGVATLIHRRADLDHHALRRVATVERTHPARLERPASRYALYRAAGDVMLETDPPVVRDPFPAVARRAEQTQARGRFKLTI